MVMDYIDFIDSKDIRDFNRETFFHLQNCPFL